MLRNPKSQTNGRQSVPKTVETTKAIAMWQDESKLAMKALMDGDDKQAVTRWQRSIAMAEESCATPSAELGEVYFNLGKMLADANQDSQATLCLRKSIDMLTSVAPQHQRLDTAKYQLAALLKRNGDDKTATQLFQEVLKIEASPFTYIPLTKAIALLKECGLAFDLSGKVLKALYKDFALNGSDDNECVSALLQAYYGDTKYGDERRETDRFFCAHYTDFDVVHVVKTLGEMCGLPGLLTLVGTQYTTHGKKSNMLVTLKRDDGEEVYLSVASVVGLVSCFNKQFELRKMDMRFYDLVSQDENCCYLLPNSTFEYLRDNYALQFDCENNEPNGSGAVTPTHAAPIALVKGNVQNQVQKSKQGEQILAIQEVLDRIPLEELPTILRDSRLKTHEMRAGTISRLSILAIRG
jgi:hypothetical protein